MKKKMNKKGFTIEVNPKVQTEIKYQIICE